MRSRCTLENHMGIGSAVAKVVDGRPQGLPFWPLGKTCWNLIVLEINICRKLDNSEATNSLASAIRLGLSLD